MKVIQNTAIVVCLFTSLAGQAQESTGNTTTKPAPPVIEKSANPASKSETKKKEYKSKEWKQGMEVVTDTATQAGEKPKSGTQKKSGKPHGTPPPPPPPPPAVPEKPATPGTPGTPAKD